MTGALDLAERIASGNFYVRTGPFTAHVRTSIPGLLRQIAFLYEGHTVARDGAFADFHITVRRPTGVRRWYRQQAQFLVDGLMPFNALPLDQALPMFEWGLNWCVANHPVPYLIIHAAAVEKGGGAAILPGMPGAGKSTLTAGLVNSGWRLLSDELTIISLADGKIRALARPMSLKNESIEVIRAFAPQAKMSDVIRDTTKGNVALVRAPSESILRVDEPAVPAWIIFPKYMNGLPAVLERKSKAATLIQIGKNAFNYSQYGARAFSMLADIVEACDCYSFSYALLSEAIEIFDALDAPAGSRS